MFSFLFGNKKTKLNPTIRQSYLAYTTPISNNITVYTFTPPAGEVEEELKLCKKSVVEGKVIPSDEEILNEKKISRLITRYSLHSKITHKEQKNPQVKKSANVINVKVIRQALNRIRRYNNNRLYEERQGFASTLYDNAELIGIDNTVDFLLKVISKDLVLLFIE
jgi:hypothetical protein